MGTPILALKLGAIVASGSTRDADASDTIEALLRV
jgi:hypothetical protein